MYNLKSFQALSICAALAGCSADSLPTTKSADEVDQVLAETDQAATDEKADSARRPTYMGQIMTGHSVTGSIGDAAHYLGYSFSALKGDTIELNADGADTVLAVYHATVSDCQGGGTACLEGKKLIRATGSRIKWNDDRSASDLGSQVEFRASKDGEYIAIVRLYSLDDAGDVTVSLKKAQTLSVLNRNKCILGKTPTGSAVTRDGEEVQFPLCFKDSQGLYLTGLVDADKLDAYLAQEAPGYYALRSGPFALVLLAAIEQRQTTIGSYRESSLNAWVTKNPNDTAFDATKQAALFSLPGNTTPTEFGALNIKVWIDADDDETTARVIAVGNELFGSRKEDAEINTDLASPFPSAELVVDGEPLFSFKGAEVPTGPQPGLPAEAAHDYNWDMMFGFTGNPDLNVDPMWNIRVVTKGTASVSSNVEAPFDFKLSETNKWGALLHSFGFQLASYELVDNVDWVIFEGIEEK